MKIHTMMVWQNGHTGIWTMTGARSDKQNINEQWTQQIGVDTQDSFKTKSASAMM